MRTRIAPTPSGYLHRGNAANALLTHWWAAAEGGTTLLRIDDVDAPRTRPEYLRDIHDLLHWLDIPITGAPQDAWASSGWSDRASRVARAREALLRAREKGMPAYACTCSRSTVRGTPRGGCPGGCRDAGQPLTPYQSSLRIAIPSGTRIAIDGSMVDLAEEMGDFVLWRRDDLPAYQWLSVVEDTDLRITHILRGRDLLESSAAQMHVAQYLDDPRFVDTVIRHHDLLVDEHGRKLSKSQLGASTGLPRTEQTRHDLHRIAQDWARALGLPLG